MEIYTVVLTGAIAERTFGFFQNLTNNPLTFLIIRKKIMQLS